MNLFARPTPRVVSVAASLGLGLLGSCAAPTAESPPAASPPPPLAPPAGVGQRADSLAGIPGHRFGEPLRAFPGLRAVTPPAAPPAFALYTYAEGDPREAGWFGRHRVQLAGTYYYFAQGRFVGFATQAFGEGQPLLDQQVHFLLGAGEPHVGRRTWPGQQVWAEYRTVYENATVGQQLQLFSQAALTAQRQQAHAQIQVENAGR